MSDKDNYVNEAVEEIDGGCKSSLKRVKGNPKEKHPMLLLCKEICPRKCTTKFSNERRRETYDEYWDKDATQRREFLSQRVSEVAKERNRSRIGSKTRNTSKKYTLKNEGGEVVQVCAKFFLSCLGYKRIDAVDWLFRNLEGKAVPDRRGSHEPLHKTPTTTVRAIVNHIETFYPAISHYRRKHAPLRRYLPPSLTVQKMYDLFKESSGENISYHTYRRIFKKQNIGFTKLGEEECEACEIYKQHECQVIKESSQNDQDSSSALGDSGGMKKEDIRVAAGNEIQGVKRKKPENEKPCNACEVQGVHLERADICRKEYRLDVERNMREYDHIFSMDMQKVMMLPHLPGIKTALFTRRILFINQTIAPVGGIECGARNQLDTFVTRQLEDETMKMSRPLYANFSLLEIMKMSPYGVTIVPDKIKTGICSVQ